MSYNQPPGGYPPPPPPPGYGAPASAPLILTLGDALVAGGGLLVFIFSFTPFIDNGFSDSNAWKQAPTLFIAIAGLLLIALGLLRKFWPANGVLGFTLNHVQVGVALFVVFSTLGWVFEGLAGVGAIISLLAGLAAAAGGIMNQLGVGGQIFPSAPKAAPMGYPPPPPPTA